MKKSIKNLHFSLGNVFISVTCSFLVIAVLWLLCVGLEKVGFPLPPVSSDKFSDLGFFAFSNFSAITFLAMILFQTAEGQLSAGFYWRIINHFWSHFGLYVLLTCVITSFLILSHQDKLSTQIQSQLYMAIIGSVIFAVVFHLVQTLRYMYQPLIVYENMAQLAHEESSEELWLDLYECTLKAIKSYRIGNACNFIDLLKQVYTQVKTKPKIYSLQNDLASLYTAAKEFPPVTAQLEKHWPLLILEDNQISQKPTESDATHESIEGKLELLMS